MITVEVRVGVLGGIVGAHHDYHDIDTGVLVSSLVKRALGYVSLGFPDPRTSASGCGLLR